MTAFLLFITVIGLFLSGYHMADLLDRFLESQYRSRELDKIVFTKKRR